MSRNSFLGCCCCQNSKLHETADGSSHLSISSGQSYIITLMGERSCCQLPLWNALVRSKERSQ